MEIICAGYPKVSFWFADGENLSGSGIQAFFKKRYFKTGSKSCSAALRVLGYNVADYLETCEASFQMPASDSLICRTYES